MSRSGHRQNGSESSSCSNCNKRYSTSSQQQNNPSEQNERIVIPLRRDMLLQDPPNNQIQSTLKSLQSQIETLKQANFQKDKQIQDLKKQMEHKITHYMMYGEINKQADQINRLKSQIGCGYGIGVGGGAGKMGASRSKEISQEQVRMIVKEEARRYGRKDREDRDKERGRSQSRRKAHSTLDDYLTLRRQFYSPKKQQIYEKQIEFSKQYFEKPQTKPIFNITESKKRINQLQQKLKFYQKQITWMTNFVTIFIKSMQNLAYKKHQQQIIIPEWSLKKKAKTSWRYMKHLFNFLYAQPEF